MKKESRYKIWIGIVIIFLLALAGLYSWRVSVEPEDGILNNVGKFFSFYWLYDLDEIIGTQGYGGCADDGDCGIGEICESGDCVVLIVDDCIASTELCDDDIDNDCDGSVDEDCGCESGDFRICGSNLGACENGFQNCNEGVWETECIGGVSAVQEVCKDGIDNDCDGSIDEGCLNVEDEPDNSGVEDNPNEIPEAESFSGDNQATWNFFIALFLVLGGFFVLKNYKKLKKKWMKWRRNNGRRKRKVRKF